MRTTTTGDAVPPLDWDEGRIKTRAAPAIVMTVWGTGRTGRARGEGMEKPGGGDTIKREGGKVAGTMTRVKAGVNIGII